MKRDTKFAVYLPSSMHKKDFGDALWQFSFFLQYVEVSYKRKKKMLRYLNAIW